MLTSVDIVSGIHVYVDVFLEIMELGIGCQWGFHLCEWE